MADRLEAARRHKHVFHGLWWKFGPYGRQDVHVHDCREPSCERVLVGVGRECQGKDSPHHRETLR